MRRTKTKRRDPRGPTAQQWEAMTKSVASNLFEERAAHKATSAVLESLVDLVLVPLIARYGSLDGAARAGILSRKKPASARQAIAVVNQTKRSMRRANWPGIKAWADHHLNKGTAPHDLVSKVRESLQRSGIQRSRRAVQDDLKEILRQARTRKRAIEAGEPAEGWR
jgi:hypothetical protein